MSSSPRTVAGLRNVKTINEYQCSAGEEREQDDDGNWYAEQQKNNGTHRNSPNQFGILNDEVLKYGNLSSPGPVER
jgi:hypothetical protein